MARKTQRQPAATSWLYQSPTWPLYEVLLSAAWDQPDALPSALVARQSPRTGKIAAASFLVDPGCTGVRSAFVRSCKSADDYARRLREPLLNEQMMYPAELDLVAKLIESCRHYAEQCGFQPDPEFAQARLLLTGAHPEQCQQPVPVGGTDGKPLYIVRPNDNRAQIIATLERVVGPGKFTVRESD